MMNSLRLVNMKNAYHLRHFHRCVTKSQGKTATVEVLQDPITIPPPSNVEKAVNPKIDRIAQEITALNLIEVAELSDVLKKRLNLPDAPVMPIGGVAIANKPEEDEQAAPKQVKSSFSVKLTGFDVVKKVALIKEIKNLLPGTNLVQAKKLVESIPVVIKSDLAKDEAEQLVKSICDAGGTTEMN